MTDSSSPSVQDSAKTAEVLLGVDQEGSTARTTDPLLEIWVDDCKPAPEGCAVARTYDDALRMMRRFKYSKLYLDHDLGEKRTGYDLLLVLIEENRVPPRVECISWNPVGRKRIAAALASVVDRELAVDPSRSTPNHPTEINKDAEVSR